MYSLTYTSTAIAPFTRDQLHELSRLAREKNEFLKITGILLYKDNCFMQVLEGDREHVNGLFREIVKDGRHRDIQVIDQGEIKERRFPQWSMALFNLHDHYVNYLPGYSEFMALPLNHELFKTNRRRYHHLVNAFRRH